MVSVRQRVRTVGGGGSASASSTRRSWSPPPASSRATPSSTAAAGRCGWTRPRGGPRRACASTFEDHGPGDPGRRHQRPKDGYTTGHGLGLGLGGARRLVERIRDRSPPPARAPASRSREMESSAEPSASRSPRGARWAEARRARAGAPGGAPRRRRDGVSGQLALVVTELAGNLVKHTPAGRRDARSASIGDGRMECEFCARPRARAWPTSARCLQDGYLDGRKLRAPGWAPSSRLSSVFQMYSAPGKGTAILARGVGTARRARRRTLEMGAVSRSPSPGRRSAATAGRPSGRGTRLGMVVSRRAGARHRGGGGRRARSIRAFQQHAGQPPAEILARDARRAAQHPRRGRGRGRDPRTRRRDPLRRAWATSRRAIFERLPEPEHGLAQRHRGSRDAAGAGVLLPMAGRTRCWCSTPTASRAALGPRAVPGARCPATPRWWPRVLYRDFGREQRRRDVVVVRRSGPVGAAPE